MLFMAALGSRLLSQKCAATLPMPERLMRACRCVWFSTSRARALSMQLVGRILDVTSALPVRVEDSRDLAYRPATYSPVPSRLR